jgi:2-isopropylmalate synthase
MQIAFYQVIQAIADREAREVTVADITEAFRRSYHFGGSAYKGRLALKSFKISTEPAAYPGDESAEEDERRRFDGTIFVDGVLRVIRGDGNGPLSALLNALQTHLNIDLSIREYTEHAVGEGQDAKAASFVEVVAPARDTKKTRASAQGWWGVGVDSDIAGSGLRAVLSAVNSAIGDRELPELKLSVGFNAKSAQADIASAILNVLNLELPRRLQASFFEVVQQAARESSGEITYDALTTLFKRTYGYEEDDSTEVARFGMRSFKLEHVDGGSRRQLTGDFVFEGQVRSICGQGNGPLSAALAALHSQLEGTVSIREYSEHSIGEGTEVKAASYVELVDDAGGKKKKTSVWGVGVDTDITASGIKAVLNAASRLDIGLKR